MSNRKNEQYAEDVINAYRRREELSRALNKAAIVFLAQTEGAFNETMSTGVNLITDVIDVDRFSIWRNTSKPDGMYASQIYRWDRKSGGTTSALSELKDIPYSQLAPRWEKILSGEEKVNGPARLQPEAEFLLSFGIVSHFVTPITINNAFWGIVCFEDSRNERYFDEDSAEMMNSAAFLCVNTIIRAEMEHEIAEANQFNSATINAAPIGLTIFTDKLKVFDCNDAIIKLLGTTRQYYINNFHEFSPEFQPDGTPSTEGAMEIMKRALEGEDIMLEWVHRSYSGELIPFEITAKRLRLNDRYIALGYQYDLRNINKMKKAVEDQSALLKTRLEQQELISEISRSFLASGDSDIYVNEAIAKMGRFHDVSLIVIFSINYDKGAISPAYYWSADGKPPSMAPFDLYAMIKTSFPEKLPESTTMPIIACDDIANSLVNDIGKLSKIDVHAFICVPLYVEGKLWGVMNVGQFHRPRYWTENEKEFIAMSASTISGVIMRGIYTAMLTNALSKATAASKAKGEFLSNMSHEMRTPLNAIIGMTSIGRNASEIDRKNYALDKIDNASAHLLGVINDVLDMSKIEANMLELSPEEFHFEKMLQRVVNVVNFRLEEKQQKFNIFIDQHIPKVLVGDDQRIAQVITNLLGNAVKFTPENGSVSLDARLLEESDGLFTIQISVSDSGIGISKEQQERVFSSFEQAESSTTRKYGGTGLGLAISKSIVEMMGGQIHVESELHKGATFIFTIKVQQGTLKQARLQASNINWSDISVLIVDDDSDILEYIKEIVEKLGASCDTAINGEEALRLTDQKGQYSIYLVDYKMPGINGIALTSMIKTRFSDLNNCIVIMISSSDWESIETEAKAAGVDKFLSKPLFSSTIEEVIGDCLGVGEKHNEEMPSDITGCFEGKRILLVEDVEINREIVISLFEQTHLDITCAENGAEAVQIFNDTPQLFDLIFMDVQMPVMDGYDATRLIRALSVENAKTIPIIAMTANVFREDIEKCLNAGMDSHVGKPLDFEEVMDKLRTYLK